LRPSRRPVALAALTAVVGALAFAGSASAKSYDVARSLGAVLPRVVEHSGVPVLVPDRIALDYGGKLYPSGIGGRNAWSLSLSGAPRCGGATACFLAEFSGRRGGHPSFSRQVKLRGGVTGYFKPLSCGGSCSPPAVQFVRAGVLYEIQAKVPRGEADLVAAANSALRAGPSSND
jgi:hypothetical protein